MRKLLATLLLAASTQVAAQLPPPPPPGWNDNPRPPIIDMYLKTATYAITKKEVYPCPTTTAPTKTCTKTVQVGRYANVVLAKEAFRTLPLGDYILTTPDYYVKTIACTLPATEYCADKIDARILPVERANCVKISGTTKMIQVRACYLDDPTATGGP